MFVGRNGIRRIVDRTAEVMVRERTDDAERLRASGVIDLPTIQRYLNFHASVTVDLFGADLSSNAATFYTTGLKGRYMESRHRRRSCAEGGDVPDSEGQLRGARSATSARAEHPERAAA